MKAPRGAITAGGTFILAIFLIIALGIVWVATGGPSRTSLESGAFLTPPWPLAGSGSSTPSFMFPTLTPPDSWTDSMSSDYSVTYGSAPGSSGTGGDPFTFLSRFGVGTVSINSPYAGKVFLDAGTAGSSDPKREYVTIKTASGLDKPITLTGWSLMSAASHLVVKIREAALIPFLGQVNVETPIVVNGNATLYVVTGRSPNGASFRLSKCTGYFEQFQDFAPSLPTECPVPEDELFSRGDSASYSDACIAFVESLNRCSFNVGNIPGGLGGNCESFILNTLSYNGCVNTHKNDPDFYRNDWRIYLSRDQELWRNGSGSSWKNAREEIRLLDENGKVVDVVSY